MHLEGQEEEKIRIVCLGGPAASSLRCALPAVLLRSNMLTERPLVAASQISFSCVMCDNVMWLVSFSGTLLVTMTHVAWEPATRAFHDFSQLKQLHTVQE